MAWRILFALTFARLTMGLQFQSVPALAPYAGADGMSFAALGALTGAYLLPGVVIALAGGWLSRVLGDLRAVLGGLALMCAGGILGWWITDYGIAMAARLVAGAGAVCVNVLTTKMVADWFAGRKDLPAAMGVFVSSWPTGLAIAALALPLAAKGVGFSAASLIAPLICAAAFCLLCVVWRTPPAAPTSGVEVPQSGYSMRERVTVALSGVIWGIYNVAFIGAITWLPGFMSTEGVPAHIAAGLSSTIGWVAIFSVALGGWLATRVKRPDWVALICFAVSALLLCAAPFMSMGLLTWWFMALLGLAMGPAAAMIMTLPVDAARVAFRATTMGIYFALYYLLMALGPIALGGVRDATASAGAPLLAAAALMVLCICLWWVFRLIALPLRADIHSGA